MKYEVGQIIFMCSSKSIQVVPLKVVEEIIKTNLDGTATTYTVQFPDNKQTRVNIGNLKGKVFASSDLVKDYMIKNSTEAIEKMVKAAEVLNQQVFGTPDDHQLPIDKSTLSSENDESSALIDIGNGKKAKINLSQLEKIKNA